MIGYHYTSFENWQHIRETGLKPYAIHHPEIVNAYSNMAQQLKGIWIWTSKLQGLDHAGAVIFQAGTKASAHIVQLSVEYDDADRDMNLSRPAFFDLTHMGHIGRLQYHYAAEATILFRAIPLSRIGLIGQYDISMAFDDAVLT